MKRLVLTECVFLLVVPLLLTACWPFPGGGGGGCQPQYVYAHITDQGQMLDVTDHEQTGNNTGKDVTVALTAEKSATVTVSATAGIEADLGAIVEGVKAQLQISVSKSVTTSISNSPTVIVPDGKIVYGDYGVFMQLASGHLYSPKCGVDYGSHVLSRTPIGAGWCVWIPPESPALCESDSPILPAAGATATARQNKYTSATSGTPVLDDPLSNNSKGYGWNVGSGYCQFPGGGLHAIRASAGIINCDATGASTYSNFAFQVQMMIVSGDAGGIDFRSNLAGGGYFFTIGQDGSYNIYRSANFSVKAITNGSSAAIHSGVGQTNLVTVIAQNNTFDFYVNAQYVTTVTDSTYSQGFVGINAQDISNPTEVAFNDAKVWML